MVRQLVVFGLLLCSVSIQAQVGYGWIKCPFGDGMSQVQFRRMYVDGRAPQRASIVLATTGYCELFVNGRNVTTDLRMPVRELGDTSAVALTYDVTPCLRPDTNVVAVRFCPSVAGANGREIAVCYYGVYDDGTAFSHSSDDDWLCRFGDTRLLPDGGELMDGAIAAQYDWNRSSGYAPATWLSALRCEASDDATPVYEQDFCYEADRIVKTYKPRFFDLEGDTAVVYDFAQPFVGNVRVTFRDAVPGSHVFIGGMEYVCTGEMDEQAFRRFTSSSFRRVTITGDRHFRPEIVQKVEGLSVGSYLRVPFGY